MVAERSTRAVRATVTAVVVFDVAADVGLPLAWLIIGAVDVRLLAALLGLRSVLSFVHLWSLLGSVRRWQASGRSDEDLREYDRALQALPARFTAVYALGWVLASGLGLLVSGFEGSFFTPQASAEIVASLLLLAGSTAASAVTIVTLCRGALDPALVEASELIAERRLDVRRPPVSFTRELTVYILAMVFATFTTLTALVGMARIDSLREAEAARVLADAELDALRVDTGLIAPTAVERVGPAALPAVLAEVRETGTAGVEFEHHGERVVAAAPLADGGWVVAEAQVDEQLLVSLALMLTIVAAIMFGTALGVRALGSTLTKPLAELSEFARRMVEEGEIRELARAVPRRNNELGALMASFNDMLDMLDELALAAQTVADGDLSVRVDRRGDLHDAFGLMVDHLHSMVERLRETALEVSSATSEITASTQEHEQIANGQADAINELSEMLGSLTSAATNISEVAQGVRDDTTRSLSTSARIAEEIVAFDRQASGIGELLEAIREVADRSDLLALNGSLEATRAGDAGRGFSLVAAEMRRLAERVTAMVADVRTQLDAIQRTTDNTVSATDENRSLARGMTTAAERIVEVTRKQSMDTGQASDAAERMAESVTVAASGITQTRAACDGLQVHVGELERLTRSFELRV